MKLILFLSLLFHSLFAMGPVDKSITWTQLPDRDYLFNIEEEDMDTTFKNSLKEYLKNNDIRQQFIDSIKDSKISNTNLPSCQNKKNISVQKEFKLKDDIKLPSGHILIKKGTSPDMNFFKNFDMCVFDGSNDKNNDLLMNKFNDNCIFIVDKKNVDEMKKKYGKTFYPFSYFIQKRLNLECLPAKITFSKNIEHFNYINIKELENEKNNN